MANLEQRVNQATQALKSQDGVSRRDFLAGLGLAAAGAFAGGAAVKYLGRQEAGAAAGETATTEVFKESSVKLSGFPESVDPTRVDTAKGNFKNTLGLGSQMALAEPGGLLVGPDFDSKSNPYGDNPGGWQTMYDSGGSIRPFSPVSQEVMHNEEPFYQNLPEGGWNFFSLGQGTFELGASDDEGKFKAGDFKIELPHRDGHNYFLIIRGMFNDGEQDSDRNGTVRVTDYVPGHALAMMYEARNESNTAFISEGQFLQMAATSHNGGTNTGAEGASGLTAVMIDANTGAYAVMEQTKGRGQNAATGWKAVTSNWFQG